MSLLKLGAIVSGSLFAVGIIALLTLADAFGISPVGAQHFTTFWIYSCLAVFGLFWMAHTWKKKK
jgi:hypothetical protein